MKRIIYLLVVGISLFSILSCNQPGGDDSVEDQPVILCDPAMYLDFSDGAPGDAGIRFMLTVDANPYTAYSGLIDAVDISFSYSSTLASVWNITTDVPVDWDLDSGTNTNFEELDTPFASFGRQLTIDGTSIVGGDTININIGINMAVKYGISSQGYVFHESFTHTF